jgi:predicted lipoprotein with Yx(FWY)xxD motif
MKAWLGAAVVAASIAGAGIPVASAAVTPAAAKSAGATTLSVKSSRYGRILFDGAGRVFYAFARDHAGQSNCSGACAKAWPPVLTKGAPRVLAGIDKALVGTIKRADGTLQVSFAGHPLYYFVKDTKPGQITCQNVSNFGGLWLVVAASGKPVR